MLKVLIKKQLKEFIYSFFRFNRSKKNSSKITWIAVFTLLYASLGYCFYSLGSVFVEIFFPLQCEWLYYSYVTLLSCLFCVFVNSNMAYHTIYVAKDNDLLLSMPIKKEDIVISRMLALYLHNVASYLCMYIPLILAVIIKGYHIHLIPIILLGILFPFFTTFLCSIVGYVIAYISSKLQERFKTVAQVALSLTFLVVYFLGSTKINEFSANFAISSQAISTQLMNSPIYYLGKAYLNDWMTFAIIVVVMLLSAYLTLKIITANFIKITVSKKGNKTSKKSLNFKQSSLPYTLLKKEFMMLTNSSIYILNGCSSCMMLIVSVVLMLFNSEIKELLLYLKIFDPYMIELMVLGMIAFITSSTILSSVSISFERNHIYQMKCLPIDAFMFLQAKIHLHFIIVSVISTLVFIAYCFIFPMNYFMVLIAIMVLYLYIYFSAQFGMVCNMLLPKIDYPNDVNAVKQNLSGFVGMLGPFLIVIAFVAMYILFHLSAIVFIVMVMIILVVLNILLFNWIKQNASKVIAKI